MLKLKHTGGKQWKQYECNLCPYESFKLSNLKLHNMIKHAGKKPYQCDQCPYLSADSNRIKMHKVKH